MQAKGLASGHPPGNHAVSPEISLIYQNSCRGGGGIIGVWSWKCGDKKPDPASRKGSAEWLDYVNPIGIRCGCGVPVKIALLAVADRLTAPDVNLVSGDAGKILEYSDRVARLYETVKGVSPNRSQALYELS
jgi:hypothetical protein